MTDPLNHILLQLPFGEPFRFVDDLIHVDDMGVRGCYTFRPDLPFYRGHFRDYPVTPGALLTECCAQIGLVCLGIYLVEKRNGGPAETPHIALTESAMEFLCPVYPGERVEVRGEKIFFRFGKLKAKVSLYNGEGTLACRGVMAGVIKEKEKEGCEKG